MVDAHIDLCLDCKMIHIWRAMKLRQIPRRIHKNMDDSLSQTLASARVYTMIANVCNFLTVIFSQWRTNATPTALSGTRTHKYCCYTYLYTHTT